MFVVQIMPEPLTSIVNATGITTRAMIVAAAVIVALNVPPDLAEPRCGNAPAPV